MSTIFFSSCGGKEPVQNDIFGTWHGPDSAMLVFNRDSTFIGKALPAEYFTFFTSREEVNGKKVNGSGKWELKKVEGSEEIALNFQEMDNKETHGFYSIFIAGENGALENKAPWYLFLWKGEEGGERYKFLRK